MLLPIYVGTFDRTWQAILKEKFAFFIYLGIILSIFFYNFFVFISTRDINYLYYVIYVFFVGFAQVSLLGYSSRYIWPQSKFLIREGVNISGILSGIAVLLFVMNFLHTKRNSRVLHILVNVYIVAYCLAFIPTFLDYSTFSYKYIDILASSGVTLIWIIGLVLVFKSVKEAKFFLIAWTVFILSVILFVLKDFGFLPYNFFTKNVMLLGSAIETILISLALADKINTYKAEREQARMMALSKSEEVRIVLSQQNITLERMVKKRTEDLERANLELTQTLKNLQEAQIQLIQAEKMATLGQLTAGIAHEINNPINFVKSNVKPLQMDLYDLIALIQTYEKQLQLVLSTHALEEIEAFKKKINYPELVEEIRLLLKGIEEGAERTAEIIRGLRIFSRLDESELKKADIHECIDSTLILLRASIPDNVVIEKHYAQLPLIECYPGKLNQMLMNLLTNAIHAVKSKPQHFPQQAGEPSTEEKIIITTSMEPDGKHIRISVADTGTGMTPEVKQKIFEPFFTTKEVGEGTGLGLPIVYSIVEKHGGKIFVETTYGIGSEFIIILPTTPKTVMQTQEVKEQNS
nr:7TM diverse intracellular signaling domain-containing protein [Thermoflavifilum sp.]